MHLDSLREIVGNAHVFVFINAESVTFVVNEKIGEVVFAADELLCIGAEAEPGPVYELGSVVLEEVVDIGEDTLPKGLQVVGGLGRARGAGAASGTVATPLTKRGMFGNSHSSMKDMGKKHQL